MAQHLNLFDDRLRPPRVWVTPGRVVLLLLTVAALTGAAGWQVRQQARAAEQRSDAIETQLRQLAAQVPAVADGAAQRAEIEQLRQRLLGAQTLANAQAGSVDGRDAAAAFLQALAQAAPGDVWLDKVRWQAGPGGSVALEGRMLDPGRLPAYLRRLEAQAPLSGQRFAQVEATPVPVAAGAAEGPVAVFQFVLRSPGPAPAGGR
ncbi:MAG: PilN domain-containing protein [Inhella sp.]|uniref:PilN domain-containing protein n=1 Tax=Inhella sp. TaxID=1921806 RepID=UPI00391EEFCE